MHKASNLFKIISYADDSTLHNRLEINNLDQSVKNINDELAKVNNWLKLNKLSLNIDKSVFMIFHSPKKKITIPKIKIDNQEIKCVDSFNLLGITVNKHMTWKNHIDKISTKISRTIGILNRLKHFLPTHIKISIYNSLILSHLHFGILAWGYDSDKLLKLQKKAIRVMSNSKYNSHTDPIFKSMKLLKVTDIFQIQKIKFYHKFLNNNIPKYFSDIFTDLNNNAHYYNTRNQNDIILPRVKHEFAKKRIRYSIPEFINNCPALIKDKLHTHSIKGLSLYAKNYYLNLYRMECQIRNCYICNRQ